MKCGLDVLDVSAWHFHCNLCANLTLYFTAAAIALYLTVSSAAYAFSTPLGARAGRGSVTPITEFCASFSLVALAPSLAQP